MSLPPELRSLAEDQHALFSRAQAREHGADAQRLRRAVAAGECAPVTARVLRLVGAPRTYRQRCMAALLDGGADTVVSHLSAATLWRLPGFTQGGVEVSRPRGRSCRPTELAVLHEPRLLPAHHVTAVYGIPVTTMARTIFDLAGVIHPRRTERALDNALARRLTNVAVLRAVVDELVEQGRPGSALMRRLLDARPDDYAAPESGLEARFQLLAEAAGVGTLVRQRTVGGQAPVGRVDYLHPPRKRIYEVDSDLHHTTVSDRAADEARDRELRAAGYEVIRIREEQVWHRPWEVVAALRTA